MKSARQILALIRTMCPEGAFPGRGGRGDAEWAPDPFHVLIYTVLSQRTRDQNTHAASSRLFAKYGTPQSLAHAPKATVEMLIRPAGFPTAKAKAIKEIARTVLEEYGGVVPSDIGALMAMPMVGRKTANCVRSYAFRIPSICVDTHVHRISNRIGLVRTKTPEETEMGLQVVVPRGLWIDVNSLMVRFGQKVCLPRSPRCTNCPVAPHCDYYSNVFLPSQLRQGERITRSSGG